MLKCYAIKDNLTGAYFTPFFCENDRVALRSVKDLVDDVNSIVYRHPKDYDLYMLADIDNVSGIITPADNGPKHIISCINLVDKERIDIIDRQLKLDFDNDYDVKMDTVIV